MSRKIKKIKVQEPQISIAENNIKSGKVELQTPLPVVETQVISIKNRLPNAPFHSPACEICRSRKTKVYSIRKFPRVRYIKCLGCGWTFKS